MVRASILHAGISKLVTFVMSSSSILHGVMRPILHIVEVFLVSLLRGRQPTRFTEGSRLGYGEIDGPSAGDQCKQGFSGAR